MWILFSVVPKKTIHVPSHRKLYIGHPFPRSSQLCRRLRRGERAERDISIPPIISTHTNHVFLVIYAHWETHGSFIEIHWSSCSKIINLSFSSTLFRSVSWHVNGPIHKWTRPKVTIIWLCSCMCSSFSANCWSSDTIWNGSNQSTTHSMHKQSQQSITQWKQEDCTWFDKSCLSWQKRNSHCSFCSFLFSSVFPSWAFFSYPLI